MRLNNSEEYHKLISDMPFLLRKSWQASRASFHVILIGNLSTDAERYFWVEKSVDSMCGCVEALTIRVSLKGETCAGRTICFFSFSIDFSFISLNELLLITLNQWSMLGIIFDILFNYVGRLPFGGFDLYDGILEKCIFKQKKITIFYLTMMNHPTAAILMRHT